MAEITRFPAHEDYSDWRAFADALVNVLSVHLGSIQSVPVGHIVLFGGSATPQGYLKCDGESFSSVTYPALANRLGGTVTPNLSAPSGFSYGIRAR